MFEYFPKRWFQDIDGDHKLMTNICRKFKLPNNLKSSTNLYLDYEVQEGDTARSLATRIYEDSEMYWLVYLANDIRDPVTEWAWTNERLLQWLEDTYGLQGMYDPKYYINQYGDAVDIHALRVFGGNLALTDSDIISRHSLTTLSHEQYHQNLNSIRKSIKIIDPDFADDFKKVLEEMFNEA